VGQIRDSDSRSSLLGETIRGARLPLSGREAARRAHLSSSVLSRLELGRQVVTLDQLVALDRAWNKDGTLVTLGQQLLGQPEPLTGSQRGLWTHNFPAGWSGPVWELVRQTPDSPKAEEHRVEMRWGSWCQSLSIALGRGAILLHGKGDDGMSFTLEVSVDPPADVAFGIGAPPPQWPIMNINEGWHYVGSAGRLIDQLQSKAREILATTGRSVEELAAFLNLPVETLRLGLGLDSADRSPGQG
jgi:transcriptional regulator with XRE-family HTH domain